MSNYMKDLAKSAGNEYGMLVDDGIFGGDVSRSWDGLFFRELYLAIHLRYGDFFWKLRPKTVNSATHNLGRAICVARPHWRHRDAEMVQFDHFHPSRTNDTGDVDHARNFPGKPQHLIDKRNADDISLEDPYGHLPGPFCDHVARSLGHLSRHRNITIGDALCGV